MWREKYWRRDSAVPKPLRRATWSIWNEFREMAYMADRPFVVDDGDIREAFGLKASSLDEALAGM
jgi:hypothetical protein